LETWQRTIQPNKKPPPFLAKVFVVLSGGFTPSELHHCLISKINIFPKKPPVNVILR